MAHLLDVPDVISSPPDHARGDREQPRPRRQIRPQTVRHRLAGIAAAPQEHQPEGPALGDLPHEPAAAGAPPQEVPHEQHHFSLRELGPEKLFHGMSREVLVSHSKSSQERSKQQDLHQVLLPKGENLGQEALTIPTRKAG
jgi:hypothetical protein